MLTHNLWLILMGMKQKNWQLKSTNQWHKLPERIYNPITAIGFSAMFAFQLDNSKM